MDLLYSRYASPFEFMGLYIEQGRFGEFVIEIMEMDVQRKREAEQKENDNKLWLAYIHNPTGKSFLDWKEELMGKETPPSYAMTDDQVEIVKQQARSILNKVSPA